MAASCLEALLSREDDQEAGRSRMWGMVLKKTSQDILKKSGGGFKYFLFSSLPGEMMQFDLCISFNRVGPTAN